MSNPNKKRLRRTMMFLNAQKPGLIKDPYIYKPDSIMLDLEDAVAGGCDSIRIPKTESAKDVYTVYGRSFHLITVHYFLKKFADRGIIIHDQDFISHQRFLPNVK